MGKGGKGGGMMASLTIEGLRTDRTLGPISKKLQLLNQREELALIQIPGFIHTRNHSPNGIRRH